MPLLFVFIIDTVKDNPLRLLRFCLFRFWQMEYNYCG